jgi:hypothetical protein
MSEFPAQLLYLSLIGKERAKETLGISVCYRVKIKKMRTWSNNGGVSGGAAGQGVAMGNRSEATTPAIR